MRSYPYGLPEYFTSKKEKLETLNQDNIRDFLMLCDQKGVSARSRDSFVGAIRFCYRNAAESNQTIGIASAKRPRGLRIVLSRSGVERILSSVKNHKHKLLLSLSYGAGLRVSEAVALKARDMDSNEMTVHIKSAKGQRDRISVLPEKLINDLTSLTAEGEGFEPSTPITRSKRLAGARTRPLCDPSAPGNSMHYATRQMNQQTMRAPHQCHFVGVQTWRG